MTTQDYLEQLPQHDVHNLPCWCGEGGKDPVVFFYNDGPNSALHCFNCSNHINKKQNIINYFEENYEGLETNMSQEIKKNLPSKDRFPLLDNSRLKALEDRGISENTAKKYGVRSFYKNGELVFRSYDFASHGNPNNIVAQKCKTLDKDMTFLGSPKEAGLFGEQLFPKGGKYLTITEGEEDCLAAYEMLQESSNSSSKNKFETPVVSVKNGASAAKKDCQLSWEYINSFENVVICFDNDEPGRKAAQQVASLFPKKAKIAKLELKDANEYKLEGKQKEFITTWFTAERPVPKGVIASSNLWGDMTKVDTNTCVPFPYKGLNEQLYGQRTGEMIVYKAFPKVGKTQLLRELAYHIKMTSDHVVGLLFLEETTKRIGLGLCSLYLDKPLQVPSTEYTLDELKEAYDAVLGDDRFYIFDPRGDRNVDNVFEKIMHFIQAFECKYIFLDHITMLTYEAADENERRFLDEVSNKLKGLTTTYDIHLGVVTHVNDDGKARGSRALYQLCDALIDINRDKLNEDKIVANTMIVTTEENRISGECGLACKLFYDKDTGRLIELDEELDFNNEQEKEVAFDD